jgi:hypothetical protein
VVDRPLGSYWLPDRELGRRSVSTALALYLPLLESAVGGSVNHMLTCDECQYVDSDGRTRWRGVAFVGTATGVRGDLRSQINETTLARALPTRYRPEQFCCAQTATALQQRTLGALCKLLHQMMMTQFALSEEWPLVLW